MPKTLNNTPNLDFKVEFGA